MMKWIGMMFTTKVTKAELAKSVIQMTLQTPCQSVISTGPNFPSNVILDKLVRKSKFLEWLLIILLVMIIGFWISKCLYFQFLICLMFHHTFLFHMFTQDLQVWKSYYQDWPVETVCNAFSSLPLRFLSLSLSLFLCLSM